MKTLIAINNLTMMDQLAYANHCQLWYRLGRHYSNDEFALCNPRRMSIDRMRNYAAKVAIENNFDYLWFIDDDVLLPLDAYTKLIRAKKDIIAGVTLIRGYPYHPMIFNFMGNKISGTNDSHYVDNYAELAGPDGLLQCDAVGFSCCLISVDLLRKMSTPYFITGENHTEDVYFCIKARSEVPGTICYVDATIETAHILGSEIIMPTNKDARMAFDEVTNEDIVRANQESESRQKLIDPNKLVQGDYARQLREDIFGKPRPFNAN